MACCHSCSVFAAPGGAGLQLPVGLRFGSSVDGNPQGVSRRQLFQPAQDRAGSRHHTVQAQVVVQPGRIEAGVHPRGAQQRLRIRGKAEKARALRVVQRLDSQPVAGQEQLLRVHVPDGEGEHPGQLFDAGWPPLRVRLEDDLGVSPGTERVALRDQLLAQLRIVVNGAVEDDRALRVGIEHRLVGFCREVDDGQAPMTQADRPEK